MALVVPQVLPKAQKRSALEKVALGLGVVEKLTGTAVNIQQLLATKKKDVGFKEITPGLAPKEPSLIPAQPGLEDFATQPAIQTTITAEEKKPTAQSILERFPGITQIEEDGKRGTTAQERESFQKREDLLINQFNQNQTSKATAVVASAFDSIRSLAQTATPVADLGSSFAIIKIFDPTGRISEKEVATVENTAGVPTKFRNFYNKVLNGETLAPEQRLDIATTAQKQFESQLKLQEDLVDSGMRQRALNNGVNPDNVIVNFKEILEKSQIPSEQEAREQKLFGFGKQRGLPRLGGVLEQARALGGNLVKPKVITPEDEQADKAASDAGFDINAFKKKRKIE